ncbi:MAG: S8 family serine peptidase, partial [Mycobacteriales bacterium]
MDTARRTPRAFTSQGRGVPLLALALAASTAVSMLSPAAAASTRSVALIDVVVTSATHSIAQVAEAVRAAGGTVRGSLPLVGGVSAQLPADAVLAPAFLTAENAPITLAGKKVASTTRDATAIREALGLGAPAGEGAGVRIAIVDSGVAQSTDFGTRLSHHDVSGTWSEGESRDAYGHGTFVAGAAAGDGTASDGRYAGAAPGAEVLDIRVTDDEGATDLVTVLRGLEKAAQLDADVVNLSMSSGSQLPYQMDPLTVALSRLWARGIVVVVPAGNDGPHKASITSPGVDPRLLTVGSLDERLTAETGDDVVAPFSGRGPAPQGVAKPDLVAPGQSLVSLRATGSAVDVANPGAVVDGAYFRGSGTSFSTSVVAGVAAMLLEQRPELTPDQVKTLVTGTTYAAAGLADSRDAGAGGLDVTAALAAATPVLADADADAPPAGDVETWHAFLQALMDGDRAAAAKSWSQLSPAAHRWAAHRWAGLSPQAHRWAADEWSAHRWAGADGSAGEWQLRIWAAHRWAAHRWATDEFVAHRWAAHRWAAHRWAAHRWAAHRW